MHVAVFSFRWLGVFVLFFSYSHDKVHTVGKRYAGEYVDSGQCGPINEIKRYTETTAVVRYCTPANQGCILALFFFLRATYVHVLSLKQYPENYRNPSVSSN